MLCVSVESDSQSSSFGRGKVVAGYFVLSGDHSSMTMDPEVFAKWVAIAQSISQRNKLLIAEAVMDDCVFARAFIEQMNEPLKRLEYRLNLEGQKISDSVGASALSGVGQEAVTNKAR